MTENIIKCLKIAFKTTLFIFFLLLTGVVACFPLIAGLELENIYLIAIGIIIIIFLFVFCVAMYSMDDDWLAKLFDKIVLGEKNE